MDTDNSDTQDRLSKIEDKFEELDCKDYDVKRQIQTAVDTLGNNILTKWEENQKKFLQLLSLKFGLTPVDPTQPLPSMTPRWKKVRKNDPVM